MNQISEKKLASFFFKSLVIHLIEMLISHIKRNSIFNSFSSTV